jgi:PAS domain S-box-containing protein
MIETDDDTGRIGGSKAPEPGELFDFLLEHIPDLIFFKDRDCRFIRANGALLRLFGLKNPADVIGKSDFDFLRHEDALRTLEDEQYVLRTGTTIVGHVSRKMHPDGTPWWALTTKLPLRNARGEIIGTCGISKDITALKEAEDALALSNAQMERTLVELKELQAQLIAAEKDQSIARLAAGLAHEIRNPLSILSTGLDFVASETAAAPDSTLGIILREMRDAIHRADSVIGTLMESASPAGLRLGPCDVNALIEASLADLAAELAKARITVTRNFQSGPSFINADEQKLRQVFNGLLGNAIEAMPGGGELRVGTRAEQLTGADVTREAGSRGGQKFRAGDTVIRIDVEDTGGGIPAEALPRIFDAFFTTKETGVKGGRGLGLTVCRAIIEIHGGSLEIGNRPDASGATVVLKFKACPGADS